MTKEMLAIEFRYNRFDAINDETEYICKHITIGIFDDLKTAITEGNKVLKKLSEGFEVREKFRVNGLFGMPDRLITNCCYTTKGIAYFAKITKLSFEALDSTIETILNEVK